MLRSEGEEKGDGFVEFFYLREDTAPPTEGVFETIIVDEEVAVTDPRSFLLHVVTWGGGDNVREREKERERVCRGEHRKSKRN